MKRVLLALLLIMPTQTQALSFEEFAPTSHPLGKGYFLPENVKLENGLLSLYTSAGDPNGAEVISRSLYSYGEYEVVMKASPLKGTLSTFFLYAPPDYQSEIDIELINGTRKLMVTTYAKARQTNTKILRLSFDPSASFNRYGFTYTANKLSFKVNGKTVVSFSRGLPTAPMNLYMSLWYPTWLESLIYLVSRVQIQKASYFTPAQALKRTRPKRKA